MTFVDREKNFFYCLPRQNYDHLCLTFVDQEKTCNFLFEFLSRQVLRTWFFIIYVWLLLTKKNGGQFQFFENMFSVWRLPTPLCLTFIEKQLLFYLFSVWLTLTRMEVPISIKALKMLLCLCLKTRVKFLTCLSIFINTLWCQSLELHIAVSR